MAAPKVSVIIPAFNSAKTIERTIESILAQSMNDFEVLVIDDGSTDNTLELAGKIADPRIKCLRKVNGGVASARNYGLNNCRGEFVAYCDSDDLYQTDHLKVLSDLLVKHPEAGLVYSKALMVDQKGKFLGEWGEEFDKKKLEYYCMIVTSAVMHRRERLNKAGYWDESPAFLNIFEDWDFFLNISDNFPILYIDKPTIIWTRLSEGLLSKTMATPKFFDGFKRFIAKRIGKYSNAKSSGNSSPFDGYYFHIFLNVSKAVELGETLGHINKKEVFIKDVVPMFEGLSGLDQENPELWLLLSMLYYMTFQKDKLVNTCKRSVLLFDRMPKIEDRDLSNLIVFALKNISSELLKAGEKELSEKYSAKISDYSG